MSVVRNTAPILYSVFPGVPMNRSITPRLAGYDGRTRSPFRSTNPKS